MAMANLSNVKWMIALVALFAGVFSEETPSNISLNNVPFNCNMDITTTLWKLGCMSGNAKIGLLSTKFFYLNFQGNIKDTSSITFHDLLNSTSLADSEFFCCDNIWRAIIRIDPSSLAENCLNFSKHIAQSIHELNESFITSISITNVPHFEGLMTILNESSRLNEVRICNNNLPNITNFLVHTNNSIDILVLEQNKIEHVDGKTLSKLRNLTSLDLSKNYLKHINQSLLGNLTRILNLDLSYNLIEEISNDTFSNMFVLRSLSLQNNKLKYISETLFSFNSLLQALDLSNNDLKALPPTVFHKLTDLTNISCSNCSLVELDQLFFVNSIKLQYVVFPHNHIQFIPDDIFRNLTYLTRVNLGFNRIKKLNRNIFSFHPYMRFLNLTQNEISSIPSGTFDGSRYIYALDLSGNKIDTLTDEHVQVFSDLEYFDLRRNKIQVVELGQMKNVYIRGLFLSDNLISKLKVKWKKLVYLESFYIDNNRLTSIDLPPCIKSIKQTITFSFKYNKITNVKLNSLMKDEMELKTDKKKMAGCLFNGDAKNFVDLTRNPLICDCYLFPLYTYIKGMSKTYQLETFLDVGNLTCIDPQFGINKKMINLKDDAFNCLFSKECPVPCTCGIRGKDNATFVNCSGNNMQNFPKEIPKDTTVLYFNENRLRSMHSLNGNHLKSLKEFHLDNNSLTDLNDWDYPASLRYLSVRGNNLTTIPTSLMHFIANRTDFLLYFGDNDKNCACDREELKNFIIENVHAIGDVENIVCEVINNGTTAYLRLSEVPDSELCPDDGLNYNQKKIIISLCFFFTLLIIVLLTYYRQRHIILSFFYIHCDQLFHLFYSEEEYDEDKIFDAFVAYSSNDRDIVMDILQELENHPPYFKLCIHERNWVPGRFICDNILSSVQSSKRTIIVLSNSFIKSPWFTLELRAAVSRMSKDKISRIIIILAEKGVSLSNVDSELRHVISKRTYLVWKERWFWEKFRYAMPRKRYKKGNDTAMHRTKRSNSTQSLVTEHA